MLTQTNRPFSFDEMIGQKGIISEMRKRSKTMEFPEVMIFEGGSGLGKTTLAYIIAAILNDPNPIVNEDGSKSPNYSSPSTKAIRDEVFNRDTKLYDASSMSKDDVLNLGRSLSNAPMFDKHKVIIIDEAQELSKAGKGVTLELLEKKRKGTYIILCTMAIETFDKAVQSRGHVYTFRTPSSSDIAEYLFTLTESLTLPDVPEIEEFLTKGIFILAENCEGSIRMAVQNLERCVFGEFWTESQIEQEFSFMSIEKLSNLILKILKKDYSCIKEIKNFGTKDFYYKALKTLNDAYLYSVTGFVDQPWKERFAKSIKSYDLEKVISTLLEVDKGVYFREDLFFYHLTGLLKPEPSRKVLRESAEAMIEELSNPVDEFKKKEPAVRERVVRQRI